MKKRILSAVLGLTLAAAVTVSGISPAYAEETVTYTDVTVTDQTDTAALAITEENFKTLYDAALLIDKSAIDVHDGILSEYEMKYAVYPQNSVIIPGKVKNVDGLELFTLDDTVFIENYAGKTLTLPDNIKRVYVNPTASRLKIVSSKVEQIYIMENISVKDDGGYYQADFNDVSVTGGKCKKIDISGCKNAQVLHLGLESVETLVLPSSGSKLKVLDIYDSKLASLDLSHLKKLELLQIECALKLTSLNTNGASKLKAVCLTGMNKLTSADLSKNKSLEAVYITDDNTTAKLPSGYTLGTDSNEAYKAYYALRSEFSEKYEDCFINSHNASIYNFCSDQDTAAAESVEITEKNFPHCYQYLKNVSYDSDQDGVLDDGELSRITYLGLLDAKNDLSELSCFTNLDTLYLYEYQDTKLTVKNENIKYIYVDSYAGSLVVNAPYAKDISVCYMQASDIGRPASNWRWDGTKELTKVDLSKCKSAVAISVDTETVSSVILPEETENLKILELDRVKGKVDISKYKNLEFLLDYYNTYAIDASKNTKLICVWFGNTSAKTKDLSNAQNLQFYCVQGKCKLKFADGTDPAGSSIYNYFAYLALHRIRLANGLREI